MKVTDEKSHLKAKSKHSFGNFFKTQGAKLKISTETQKLKQNRDPMF